MPDVGEGVVEGEIVKWLVKEGDPVKEDQALVEVMTDKATVTIPSPKRGRVAKTHGQVGDLVKVHATLVTLELDGGAEAAAPKAQPAAPAPAPAPALRAAPRPAGEEGERVLATPVTRRMAREAGIDLAQVSGSGPQGRVTKADLMAAIGEGAGAVATGAVEAAPGLLTQRLPPASPLAQGAEDQRIPMRGLRRRIAEKMVRSKMSAPHFTFVEEVDATELVAMRERINAALKAGGESQKLSYLPFICKALVQAMRKFPHLNSNFDEATQELILRKAFNFGIAVATDEGLTVAVIHDVDKLTLRELNDELARVAAAARAKKLKLEDMVGGTFTITSLGQTGGLFATPIINHPEVAILGVHRIRKVPVVRDDQIVIRQVMYLSLAFDHRVIDGNVGADFTYAVIRALEHPDSLVHELA
ncbi:MAG: dihydrolipoamide acetyltransferase family protein [Myxococcaceae bacterium]